MSIPSPFPGIAFANIGTCGGQILNFYFSSLFLMVPKSYFYKKYRFWDKIRTRRQDHEAKICAFTGSEWGFRVMN